MFIAPKSLIACTCLGISLAAPIAVAGNPVVNEDSKITPLDGVEFQNFGRAIDTDNGVIVVGADTHNINGSFISSAYLFKASNGIQTFKLNPGPGNAGKGFGRSVALGNGIVAVGADIGPGSGTVYLFSSSSGILLREITPAIEESWNRFGYSVAIDDGILAVGAIWDGPTDNGAVYLFDVETGEQLGKIVEAWPRFGWSVAMDDGVLVTGATFPNAGSNGRVFLHDIETRSLLHTLAPSQAGLQVNFGHAVSVDNGLVAVGAFAADDRGEDSGSAYIFNTTTGEEKFKLTANDGQAGDLFGSSLAIKGGTIAIGSPFDVVPGANRSGSVYLFDALTGSQLPHFVPSDGAGSDRFGWSVAIDSGLVVTGAWGDDDNGSGSGSIYLYQLECAVDLNGDGSVNFFDLSIFLSAFTSQDPSADMNGDGSWNFFDVSLFLNAFTAGCA